MCKLRRFFIVLLCFIIVLSLGQTNVLASHVDNSSKNNLGTSFTNILPNGDVEEIYINENREVFVNGINITTITPVVSKNIIKSYNNGWIFAGQNEYRYDLAGISVSAGVKICKKLGLTTMTVKTLKSISGSYVVDSIFNTGVFIRDIRTVYYKNIQNPSRPEMKEEHELYFVAEALNLGTYEKYLGSPTTYGGI